MRTALPARIRRTFEREFWPVAGKFDFFVLEKGDWRNHDLLAAARPGVYVWFNTETDEIVKVGSSLVNARARALEHIRDNTGTTMAMIADQPEMRMVLFTLAIEDRHWAAALELYLEVALEPEIKSLR